MFGGVLRGNASGPRVNFFVFLYPCKDSVIHQSVCVKTVVAKHCLKSNSYTNLINKLATHELSNVSVFFQKISFALFSNM